MGQGLETKPPHGPGQAMPPEVVSLPSSWGRLLLVGVPAAPLPSGHPCLSQGLLAHRCHPNAT